MDGYREYGKGDEFYDSPEWEDEREEALQRADYQCEKCGRTGGFLHVHHGRRGLHVLCPPCHAEEHGRDGIADIDYTGEIEVMCKFCGKPIRLLETKKGWRPYERERSGDFVDKKHECIGRALRSRS